MKNVTIEVEGYLYEFYEKIGQAAGGIAPSQVMADALLRMAQDLLGQIETENPRENILYFHKG